MLRSSSLISERLQPSFENLRPLKLSKNSHVRDLDADSQMDGHDGDDSKQSTTDMTVFVQNLLQQMQSRFQTMSESIITKIDEMGTRIDELEQSINELRAEMGTEGSPSPSITPIPKADDSKTEADSG